MVGIHHRGGTFTPSPAQSVVTGSHSPHGTPHASSPTTSSNPLTKIVVAQVYLLLSTIKEDKDRTRWETQVEQLRKLVDEHGMEVFQKYFTRLVIGNASQIFPGSNRTVANPANYQILVNEVHKITHDVYQAGKIAESIESANEELFREFDLSTFMDHFKLDALEKTTLALAFKTVSRVDLKAKADAILSANFQQFLSNLARPLSTHHGDLTSNFVATLIDRFIQYHPPGFAKKSQDELLMAVRMRYLTPESDSPPTDVLAAMSLTTLLVESNWFTLHVKRKGSIMTIDEDTCIRELRSMSMSSRLDESQVAAALLYSIISRDPKLSSSTLVSALARFLPKSFRWRQVVAEFDMPDLRITTQQFFVLYEALRPLAETEEHFDIQMLWGGRWANSETQLSFMTAYASLTPEQLDASTIPGLRPSYTMALYAGSTNETVTKRAQRAVKHPLISAELLSAVFYVALSTHGASDTHEAKRLFQEVVVPNLDLFLVSAFGVPKPWPELSNETISSLFDRFLYKIDPDYDFVLFGVWRQDQTWVMHHLIEAHAKTPLELPTILEHARKHDWLPELLKMLNGFALDLAALAHAKGYLELEKWEEKHSQHAHELGQLLLTFLSIKAEHELQVRDQADGDQHLLSVMLPVKTVSALLDILQRVLPAHAAGHSMAVQRQCITAYPRLINYGQGFDDIIDANGVERNSLPKEANDKMEEHYKRMYNEDIKVVNVLEALRSYKMSRDPTDQDVFSCMIHGLFDEYTLYGTYPLEALKTTALLFGGIIRYKLLPDLPLEIGLGMILDAVKDHSPDQPMYKFGLEALKQTLDLFDDWPGLCRQLVEIPQLKGTDAWSRAEDVVREQEGNALRNGHGGTATHLDGVNGDTVANGSYDEMLSIEPSAPEFGALNVDPFPRAGLAEEPSEDLQEKVLFVLNNITERNIDSKFMELRDVIQDKHQSWFAAHLVEDRAKMQPNYHTLYLDLVRLFEDKSLWAEVLRETYVSVVRMLNAESTMQSSTERAHLKNLGDWLGSLTLARDKPIKHRNIAFKQLLMEAFDTQRLIVVLPFVCRVLVKGAESTVFKPPNPWLMDIIHFLIELYHHAELKLNLKFDIEILCRGLSLDYKSIEPSSDIQTRLPPIDEPTEPLPLEVVDRFDSLSLNGMGGGVSTGRFSPQDITSNLPDLGPLLTYPPANEIVNQAALQEIVRTAITRAVYEIISPVVERSVTIAAISTAQMIHKDFATEPDENRVRSAAINMVKRTAGSLALVTSKEPLRASMSNYIRALSGGQGLPEGTIIMCVNSNLDMVCNQVEKKAEERAVPEIEEIIEQELEARRQHRRERPGQSYVDPGLTRWGHAIPDPYKLVPARGGLNHEQMAIYDEFARQPRIAPSVATSHEASSSDATRSIANDILQDYPAMPTLPTAAENNIMPHMGLQQPYAQPIAPIAGNRAAPIDPDMLANRINELLDKLVHSAAMVSEQHFEDLPRPHPLFDILDGLHGLMIRNGQVSYEAIKFTAEQLCLRLFSQAEDGLTIEVLMHSLGELSKFSTAVLRSVVMLVAHQPDERLLNVPLAIALIRSELLDWQRIDAAASKALLQHKEAAIEFLASLMHQVLLNDRPMALRTDFARSLEALAQWIREDPGLDSGKQLVHDLTARGLPPSIDLDRNSYVDAHRDQMEYTFDEWVHLCQNPNASELAFTAFIDQLHNKQILNDVDSSCLFFRLCIDASVERFEQILHNTGLIVDAYLSVDALAKLIARLVKQQGERSGEVKSNKARYLNSVLSLVVLVLNHHHVMRGEAFNQKVFFRLFSTILSDFKDFNDQLSPVDRQEILTVFADIMLILEPARFPGFVFGWLSLVAHRDFVPELLDLPGQSGWESLMSIMVKLLLFVGEMTKPLQPSHVTRDVYQGAMKILIALHHDYPEFLAGNHARLCAAIPLNCAQLQNLVLTANPSAFTKLPDPLQPGLKVDRIDEIRQSPPIPASTMKPLQQAGLVELVDQALQSGPSEDAVAHIAHAIHRKKGNRTSTGFVPINVDTELIDALVLHVAMYAIAKAARKGSATFVQASPDAALLTMLIHELDSEARYYFLNSIVNQLRFANAHTHYFIQALLEVFGTDMNDPDELDIRQQIVRIILERAVGTWPQPWGLVLFLVELIKNEKYHFFELPFIKASPDVAERFDALVR